MFQIDWISRVVVLAMTLSAVSCHNPKAASKANFKHVIQAALDKRQECLSIALPNEPRGIFDAKPRTDPQLDALVVAGLASKKQVMMENSGWTLFGGPKLGQQLT